jgi:uracil-DNA glycosylase
MTVENPFSLQACEFKNETFRVRFLSNYLMTVRTPSREAREYSGKDAESAAPYVPATRALPALAKASRTCRGCELYRNATQTVFGEGPRSARVIMIGEQPGDKEDQAGKPFVGPAGRMLDKALVDAGVDRKLVYVTNAVKHFRFVTRGRLRFHQKPSGGHIKACRPWLEAEIDALQPELLVCLGATAAQSVFGKAVTITPLRGQIHAHSRVKGVIVTVHPSSLLRTEDEEERRIHYAAFVNDLKLIRKALGQPAPVRQVQ